MSQLSIADAGRSRLRTILASIKQELSQLPTTTPPNPLQSSFAELVAQLDLGAEPEVRACPTCGRLGLREATRCGNCWAQLTPIPR